MCSVVRRDGDQCPGHHLKVGGPADSPTGCSARNGKAPVEGTTEVSEVSVEPGAEEDRLGAAGLAGAGTQRAVQPADLRTAGGCIEQPLRSAVRLSCQRSPKAKVQVNSRGGWCRGSRSRTPRSMAVRQHSSSPKLSCKPTCQIFWTFFETGQTSPCGHWS